MAGSLRPKHNGWELAVSAGFDPATGKRRRVVRFLKGSRRDAEKALAKLLTEVGVGGHATTTQTFGELLDRWLEMSVMKLSPKTVHDYERIVELSIRPALGNIKLERLDPAQLDRLYSQLRVRGTRGRPLAASSVRKVHAIVRAALQQGLKWGWVPTNVAARASPPSVHRSEVSPPRPDVVRRLIQAARLSGDDDLADFLWLAAVTGARRGELCGLHWSDLDHASEVLLIKRALVEVKGVVIAKDTKTHQARRVAVDSLTSALLVAR